MTKKAYLVLQIHTMNTYMRLAETASDDDHREKYVDSAGLVLKKLKLAMREPDNKNFNFAFE